MFIIIAVSIIVVIIRNSRKMQMSFRFLVRAAMVGSGRGEEPGGGGELPIFSRTHLHFLRLSLGSHLHKSLQTYPPTSYLANDPL